MIEKRKLACSSKEIEVTSFRDNLLFSLPFLQNQNKNKWQGREDSHSTFKVGFFAAFVARSHCLWCPKSRCPPLCASIAVKIDKNGLEARKLQPLEVGGG